jgi:branched-subunit amino acid aminotransferase/4-amino-4-deoxychorismate lyase
MSEVRISAGDMLGDGLFETLRVDQGQAGDVEAHLDRLFAGLPRVGIDPPEDREALAAAVLKVAEASPWPVARMRIAVTQETRLISLALYTPPAGPVSAVLLPEPWIWSRSPLAGLKSLSYQANRLALRRAGVFEALLLNERGHLVEGSRSNVILALPDGLFTPPVEDGCLPGTVRRRLLERGEIAERSLSPADLKAASRVLLTNSLIGVLEVENAG